MLLVNSLWFVFVAKHIQEHDLEDNDHKLTMSSHILHFVPNDEKDYHRPENERARRKNNMELDVMAHF